MRSYKDSIDLPFFHFAFSDLLNFVDMSILQIIWTLENGGENSRIYVSTGYSFDKQNSVYSLSLKINI